MIDLRLKYGTNNIPILSNETIDKHAELLIGDYDSSLLSKPQAIDVEVLWSSFFVTLMAKKIS